MLLAKIQQTDEQLVITPMEYIGWDTILSVMWLPFFIGSFIITKGYISLYGVRLKTSVIDEIIQLLTPILVICMNAIRSTGQRSLWRYVSHKFTFDRNTCIITRNSNAVANFSDVQRVSLVMQNFGPGVVKFHVDLILSNCKSRLVLATSIFTFAKLLNHNPLEKSQWKPYPADSLPTNVTEYEIVMIANLIHDYLGLQGPRPCTNLAPSPSQTPSKTY